MIMILNRQQIICRVQKSGRNMELTACAIVADCNRKRLPIWHFGMPEENEHKTEGH